MSELTAVLKVNESTCLLCQCNILKNEDSCKFEKRGWENLKIQAKSWEDINIPVNDKLYQFQFVYKAIKEHSEPFGKAHKTKCRISFRTKITDYRDRYGSTIASEGNVAAEEGSSSSNHGDSASSRVSRCKRTEVRLKCFICDTIRPIDSQPFDEGGLARCGHEKSKARLNERSKILESMDGHRFYDAAKRYTLLHSGQSFDTFAIDLYYHKSCYIKYALKPFAKTKMQENQEKVEKVWTDFEYLIRKRLIGRKEAFLLNKLLEHFQNLCEEYDLDDPVRHTYVLRTELSRRFSEEINFTSSGKYVIVYSAQVNPCDYSIATLKGSGISDNSHIQAFSNFINKKVNNMTFSDLPIEPEKLIEVFETEGPIPDLYNTIYSTVFGKNYVVNKDGYAITESILIANKIWSVASDWQSLITRKPTAKQAILGLTLHRLTGSKECADEVHKCAHSISYSLIRNFNTKWAKMHKSVHTKFPKNITLHSTIDNNDWCQDTTTGSGTTHHTNTTLFHVPLPNEQINLDIVPTNLEITVEEGPIEIPKYAMPKKARVDPKPFPVNPDDDRTDLLNEPFVRDIAWSVANGLPSYDAPLPLLGSWTAFNRKISQRDQEKSQIEFMPVISEPPHHDVCKYYLDTMNNIIKDLELDYIFVHADEDVYARLAQIIWKHSDAYKKVIIFMGGFHTLRVRQRLIYKRFGILDFKAWYVDAGTIAVGSADNAVMGKHYYRNMRLLKESFDALVQYRVDKLTEIYTNIDNELHQSLTSLRKNPSFETLQNVLENHHFQELSNNVMTANGKQSKMTVEYLRDVSSLLAMVSSVREGDIERHLQAERDMLKTVFAFDHQNYSRYLGYQHQLLSDMKIQNRRAFQELKLRGFGANYTGSKFASVHGDLVTEYFNRETKGKAAPFRLGYSTDIELVNKWVANTHIHAKLRMKMRDKLNMKTSSTHKELTEGGKKKHEKHVNLLKETLASYQIDPFDDGPVKVLTTGVEVDCKVADGLIDAPNKGNEHYLQFVNDCLVTRKKSIFSPICKLSIDTGFKKKKITKRAVEVLKEDLQAFGLLAEKSISLLDGLTYPITSVPLSLAHPDGHLRQSNKSNSRNKIIAEASNSLLVKAPQEATWIHDGMALYRKVKPEATYREWMIKVVREAMSEPIENKATEIHIVNDQYWKLSTKTDTRLARGEGEVSRRVYLRGFDQKMLKGNEWLDLFHNGENKENLIDLFCRFMKTDDGRKLLRIPLVINCKNETWRITKGQIKAFPECNHEEADTRMVFHAVLQTKPVVIEASDSDVFFLLAYAMNEKKIQTSLWYQKIDEKQFVDIRKICDHLGQYTCSVLPQLHAITGCDQTSYKHKVGKLRVFNKILKDTSLLEPIENLGKDSAISDNEMKNTFSFVQTVLYGGNKNESYVESRVRLFKNLKTKSSIDLPADPDSMTQEIKRCHLQAYVWLRCFDGIIDMLDPEDFGWRVLSDEMIVPVWFTGYQVPASLRKEKKKIRSSQAKVNESCEASQESEAEPSVKRRKRKREAKTPVTAVISEYDADTERNTETANESSDDDMWESDFSSNSDNDDSSDDDYWP